MRGSRGSILIVTLWCAFFLAALSVAVSLHVKPRLDLAGRLIYNTKTYYLAVAGVERAILETKLDKTDLYDELNDSWSRNNEAFREVELGDGVFSIVPPRGDMPAGGTAPADGGEKVDALKYGLVDEERKININTARHDTLQRFFEDTGGLSPDSADDLADAVLDWRGEEVHDPPEGYEYCPKKDDFEVLEELLLVLGMSGELFGKVRGHLTVYGEGRVNVNTADGEVLGALGLSEELIVKIKRFRAGEDAEEGTADDNFFDDIGRMAWKLNEHIRISNREIAELSKASGLGLFTVRSDNFSGSSCGYTRTAREVTRITFVYDRANGVLRYWNEK